MALVLLRSFLSKDDAVLSRQCFHCDLTGMVKGNPHCAPKKIELSEIVQFTHRYARYTIIYLYTHVFAPYIGQLQRASRYLFAPNGAEDAVAMAPDKPCVQHRRKIDQLMPVTSMMLIGPDTQT